MTTAMAQEFETFWKGYPVKSGKLAAMRAYEKARKLATAEQILEGVAAYRQHKPGWQKYAHASSWLNAGRWLDEYDTPAVTRIDAYAETAAYHRLCEEAKQRQARKQAN